MIPKKLSKHRAFSVARKATITLRFTWNATAYAFIYDISSSLYCAIQLPEIVIYFTLPLMSSSQTQIGRKLLLSTPLRVAQVWEVARHLSCTEISLLYESLFRLFSVSSGVKKGCPNWAPLSTVFTFFIFSSHLALKLDNFYIDK